MKYYVVINDKEFGPFDTEQLSALDITAETEVWAPGMDEWQLAGNVPELAEVLERCASRRVPERVQRDTCDTADEPKRKRGGCLTVSLVLFFVLLISMAVTVPDREEHLKTITGVTHEWIGGKVNENIGDNALGDLAKVVGGMGTDIAIREMFSYKNYWFVSMGYCDYGQGAKPVSIGLFGHVFTFSKDDINKAFESAMSQLGADESPQPQQTPDNAIEPDLQPVPEDNGGSILDPALEYIDSMKNSVVKEAKDWVKQQIDEL